MTEGVMDRGYWQGRLVCQVGMLHMLGGYVHMREEGGRARENKKIVKKANAGKKAKGPMAGVAARQPGTGGAVRQAMACVGRSARQRPPPPGGVGRV